jgi:aspartyl-tRNA(Asn)/glutamyl-tRNA(Gln) amidotransferase subunit A
MDIVEKTKNYIEKIKKEDSNIGSFIEIWEEDSIKRALYLSKKQNKGKLYGKIVAIKDNILFEGKEITAASKILKNHISTYSATVVKKLLDEDAIIIGRTNMDEFAMGSSNENSSVKITRNPLNTDYVPGGSSGGSAAAVSAGFCEIALGSDTGGSIRQPAAYCGIYGLKPTYGSVSRYGLIAFASSLDQIGPMAKNIEDLKDAYNTIKGWDPNDATTYKNIVEPPDKKISEISVGIIKFEKKGMDLGLLDSFEKFIDELRKRVKNVVEIEIPHLKYAIGAYYIISSSEASSNLARFDGLRYGSYVEGKDLLEKYEKTRGELFGSEVKRRIILGTYALSTGYYDEYYLKAQKVRTIIKNDFDEAFKKVDVLVIPTTPTPAFKIGEKINDPLSMYLNDIFTVSVNLCGICALNIPFGKNDKNLPYGMQVIANNFCEKYLFEIAKEIR